MTIVLRFRISRICFFLFGVAFLMPVSATEPLLDQYIVGSLRGNIWPAKECCWLKLPPSDDLQTLKRAEMMRCSAIGGPVGIFEHKEGKLWLTGLYRCSGAFSHRELYPHLDSPALATWLSGSFKAKLGHLCYQNPQQVFALEQTLTVENGVVTSLTETRSDPAVCAK